MHTFSHHEINLEKGTHKGNLKNVDFCSYCHRLLKKSNALAEDRTGDLSIYSLALYHVAIKAVQVYYMYIPIPCDILPLHIEFALEFSGVQESLEMRLKELWVIYVGRHLSQTLKKIQCPGRGSNRGPFDLQSSTLPRRYKSWLVPQGSTSVLYTYTL